MVTTVVKDQLVNRLQFDKADYKKIKMELGNCSWDTIFKDLDTQSV